MKADSLLVLTGVTSPAEAVLAPPGQRPTYIAEDLSGLVEPQPAVTSGDDGFSCGGWAARWADGNQLELSGHGTKIDGLRALCAAAWSRDRSPDGPTKDGLRQVLQTLGYAVLVP